MKYLEYILFIIQKALIALMPFRFIYAFSDIIAFLFRFVFRYRIRVVTQNLRRSFPGKNSHEISIITWKFYQNLSDIMIESIKGYSVSISQLAKRYTFTNLEVADKYFYSGQDIILALSHYGNWEWGSQIAGVKFKHFLIAFYKPLANKYIDKYIETNRAKRKIRLISIDNARIPPREEGAPPRAFLFISDQNTSSPKAHWMTFLNQDTPCFRGMDVYARQYKMPVIYIDVQRMKRGFYNVYLEELISEPEKSVPGEIVERYMRKLESIVIKKPEDWLWSHRRWKRSRHPEQNKIGFK